MSEEKVELFVSGAKRSLLEERWDLIPPEYWELLQPNLDPPNTGLLNLVDWLLRPENWHRLTYDDVLDAFEESAGKYTLLQLLAKAFYEGSQKYEARNWERGMALESIANHAVRHIARYLMYPNVSKDTELSHAFWNCLAMVWEQDRRANIAKGVPTSV
jgi:hypothetical protein